MSDLVRRIREQRDYFEWLDRFSPGAWKTVIDTLRDAANELRAAELREWTRDELEAEREGLTLS